ncbi:MAG: gluconeogenesis factor YvcK family protein, partial [Bacilli bacterium]
VMTQQGETNGYSALDHVDAIHRHVGTPFIQYVIVNKGKIPKTVLQKYAEEGAEPVSVTSDRLKAKQIKVVRENLVDFFDGSIRHNKKLLAKTVIDLLQ